MDKITIKNAPFSCFIGILDHEKKRKHKIFIDLELYTDILQASRSDNINYAIDYTAVYEEIGKTVEAKQYNLIETLAEAIAGKILKKFDVKKIMVRIKKPRALQHRDVEYTAVEITRP